MAIGLTDPAELYDIDINYDQMGGGTDVVSAISVPGDPSGIIKVSFPTVSDAADPGQIQISSVISQSTGGGEPVSSDFVVYTISDPIAITTCPVDTTVSSCLAAGPVIDSFLQIGMDIDGEEADDESGFSVSMSADGSRVAIGAIRNDGNGSNSGHTRLYEWDGVSWVQLGADIDGEAAGDNLAGVYRCRQTAVAWR